MSKELKLYEITHEIEATLDALANEDDLTKEQIEKVIGSLKMEFKGKAINVSLYIRNLEAVAKSIKEAEENMQQRRKSLEKQTQSIKEYLKFNMQKSNITKISCPYFDISLKKSKDKVIIDDQKKLDPAFIRTKIIKEPDKIDIKASFDRGQEVEGAHLEESYSLVIK